MTLSSLFIKKIIETQKNKNNFLQRFKMGKSNLFFNSEISCTFCTLFHDYTGTCCLQCKIFVCLYLASNILYHDKGISKGNSGTFCHSSGFEP